jgi:hypothetical protein
MAEDVTCLVKPVDRLEEISERAWDTEGPYYADIDWLIEEVKRLREVNDAAQRTLETQAAERDHYAEEVNRLRRIALAGSPDGRWKRREDGAWEPNYG